MNRGNVAMQYYPFKRMVLFEKPIPLEGRLLRQDPSTALDKHPLRSGRRSRNDMTSKDTNSFCEFCGTSWLTVIECYGEDCLAALRGVMADRTPCKPVG